LVVLGQIWVKYGQTQMLKMYKPTNFFLLSLSTVIFLNYINPTFAFVHI